MKLVIVTLWVSDESCKSYLPKA